MGAAGRTPMTSPFAESVKYKLKLRSARASGFQVGLYAICTDEREVNGGREIVSAHFIDHMPTGLTYVWCDTFALALEIADAASFVTGDATEAAELDELMFAVDFGLWVTHVLEADASGRAHYRYAEWNAQRKGTGSE